MTGAILMVGFDVEALDAASRHLSGTTILQANDAEGAARAADEQPLDLVVTRPEGRGIVEARLRELRPGLSVVEAPLVVGSDRIDGVALAREVEIAALRRGIQRAEATAKSLEDLAVVGRLTAGVLHEIGNALDASRRYVRLARREEIRDDERRESLDLASQAIDRTVEILRSTLAFSREAAVRDRQRPLAEVIDEAIRFTEEQRGSVRVTTMSDGLKRDVPGSMLQVLVNLLRNAYRSCGGRGQVRIVVRKDKNQLRITVEDDGAGFDPALAEILFEPFQRNGVRGSGTGLGLTLSRQLVERSLGRLSAASEGPGRGARFTILLPDERDPS